MVTRKCKVCGVELPLTPEYFRPHSGNKNGYRWICKECTKKKTFAKSEGTVCGVDGCNKPIKNFRTGLCGMHHKRLTVHGDVNYTTPKKVMAKHSREAKLRVLSAKKTSYRKYFGRHEHRVVAEQMLGRPLRRGEVVHHIDQNKHNNIPKNLMVFKCQKDHADWHAKNDQSWGTSA